METSLCLPALDRVLATRGEAGAAIGQALIPIPVVGALLGSVVGSLVAQVGVKLSEWTVAKLKPHLERALDRAASALFAVDLVYEAHALGKANSVGIATALTRLEEAGQRRLVLWQEMQLTPIEIDELHAVTAAQNAQLEQLEQAISTEVQPEG